MDGETLFVFSFGRQAIGCGLENSFDRWAMRDGMDINAGWRILSKPEKMAVLFLFKRKVAFQCVKDVPGKIWVAGVYLCFGLVVFDPCKFVRVVLG